MMKRNSNLRSSQEEHILENELYSSSIVCSSLTWELNDQRACMLFKALHVLQYYSERLIQEYIRTAGL